eukprot:g4771.t1
MNIPIGGKVRAVGDWNTFPQPLKVRGEATVFHTIDPKAPAGNRGAGGGVSGPILAAMMQESATLATLTSLRHTEQIMGTLEINVNYIRRASGKQIFAAARVLKKGKTVSFVEIDVYNDDERLVCNGHVLIGIRLSGIQAKDDKFEYDNFENILNKFWKSNRHHGYHLKLLEKNPGSLKFQLLLGARNENVGLDDMAQILPGVHDIACVTCIGTIVNFDNGEYMNGTINLNMSYLQPYLIHEDFHRKNIRVSTQVDQKLKSEGQIAFANCKIDCDGQPLAVGRIVYSIGKKEEAVDGAFSL